MQREITSDKKSTFFIFTGIWAVLTVAILCCLHVHFYGYLIAAAVFGVLIFVRFTRLWGAWRRAVAVAVCVILLFMSLFCSVPRYGAGFAGSAVREVIRTFFGITYRFKDEDSWKDKFSDRDTSAWSVKEGRRGKGVAEMAYAGTLPMCLYTPDDAPEGRVLLQLHGGAYVHSLNGNDLYAAEFYAKKFNCAVLTPNYRCAPEDVFPAALEDAVAAYEWLLENGYRAEDIVVIGDSAGGGLALALVLYLRDNDIALPGGLVTMSAWADLTMTGASYTDNFSRDPFFGKTEKSIIHLSNYAEHTDKTNPYVSPVYGDFTGFPPMLMQAGSEEMLLSDTLTVAAKAESAGVAVQAEVYEGMFHVFQLMGNFAKESQDALSKIKDFLEQIWQ